MHIATKSSKIDISLEEDTKSIAQKFSKYIGKGDIIFLYGEVGVGKTTFIKYLINNLQLNYNLKKTEVPSPTFNLLNEYQVKNLIIQHYDLYRLKDETEIKNIGLFENYADVATLIEWPEIIKEKPHNRVELFFNYEENFNKRNLIIFSDFKKEMIYEFNK